MSDDLFPQTSSPPSDDIVDFRAAPVYRREANDWYVEPEWAVAALVARVPFDGLVYDPACGSGTIPRVFRRAGFATLGSDIVDRSPDLPAGHFCERDFLRHTRERPILRDGQILNIVSNPPFKNTEAFARRALAEATGIVALLLPLAFLESEGRLRLWRETPLSRVLVFGPRVSMPPGHLVASMKAEGGKVAFAWFVWETGYVGEPRLGWLEKPR